MLHRLLGAGTAVLMLLAPICVHAADQQDKPRINPARIADLHAILQQAQLDLEAACTEFGYPDIDTCVSIAANERWVPIETRGCVISDGRAWGCTPGGFGILQRDK
jgi:hypothetical protein